ncbi:hypothetical protein J4G07_10805 [Candidatus Poribacteria bacterium]|nr:hypothetical protein [Candidatus Poribacteria bacterium]
MRYTVRIFLLLLILGVVFVGCYLKLDSKARMEQYTMHQTVEVLTEVDRVTPEIDKWIVVGENALPQVPGRIYVQKTESTANIWHTTRSVASSETGEIFSVEGSELSERQRLNLLNTGVVPKGWEVVYVDEDGKPIR